LAIIRGGDVSKTSGLGDQLYVAGVDVSGDINSLKNIHGGPAALEFTDITQSGMARLGGERDGGIDFTSYFDPAAGASHATFSALPTADVIVSYFRGTALGNGAACEVAKQANYDATRGNDGSLTFDVSTLANGFGVEWGVQLTAGKRTDTTATSPATGVDQTTVSTAFGWQAWLHVFAFTGTSVTVTIQDSADNSSFLNFGGGGGAFTAATGVTSQRLVSPGATDTVRRYVRAITTGTFSNAVFAVVFTRNTTAVVF
jgi:hypothetical protein